MLQAATLSINEGLKPLWETVAQASDIKVGIERLLEAGRKAVLNALFIVKRMRNT